MVVFRCTQRVLRRFQLQTSDTPVASSGVSGDWYANLSIAEPSDTFCVRASVRCCLSSSPRGTSRFRLSLA